MAVKPGTFRTGGKDGWEVLRVTWLGAVQRDQVGRSCGRAAATGLAPPQFIVLMTKEHIAKRCRALALRRGGGRRGSSGIGSARKGNKQGGSDQGGSNAFHDDSPQLGVGFAIAARSMAEEYRRSLRPETAKSLRDSIRKCNNQTGKWRLNAASPSLVALDRQPNPSFTSFFATINFFFRELS